jgi:hypothetical protein
LIGAAAAVFAAKLERLQNKVDEDSVATSRGRKVKALIAELVNVAAGLIGTKRLLQSAADTAESGGTLPDQIELSASLPRSMPLTAALGTELLLLSERQLDPEHSGVESSTDTTADAGGIGWTADVRPSGRQRIEWWRGTRYGNLGGSVRVDCAISKAQRVRAAR